MGCYCIRLIRHVSSSELECQSAVATQWDKNAEIDVAMTADLTFPAIPGASAHFDCSFVAGDKAGPFKMIVRGSKKTMTVLGYMTPNEGNSITITCNDGKEAETQESVDGPFPNSRGTMYYQLKAFVSEVKAQTSISQEKRARTDACTEAQN